MIYQEKENNRFKIAIILILTFIIIYSPWTLGLREIYRMESFLAAMMTEMNLLPIPQAHGEIVFAPPLFSYFSSIFYKFGVPIEYSLRSFNLIILLLLSTLSWIIAKSASNKTSAAIAATITFSSFLTMNKFLLSDMKLLGFLFINIAWIRWFYLGYVKNIPYAANPQLTQEEKNKIRNKWINRSWRSIFIFTIPIYFSMGGIGLFYLFFPLFFMRRPLTLWKRFNARSMWIGLASLTVLILFLKIYFWDISDISFKNYSTTFPEYLQHIIFFPIKIIAEFMPWSIIAWTPFCAAFLPLERTPILSKFLRIIFISFFFLFWLNPYFETSDLILIVMPLAVMTALNYWLVIRRYGKNLLKIINAFSILFLLVAILGISLYLIPLEISEKYIPSTLGFKYVKTNMINGLVILSFTILISFFIIFKKKNRAVWTHLILLSISYALLNLASVRMYRDQTYEKRRFADKLLSVFKDDKPKLIYRDEKTIVYGAFNYLKTKIKILKNEENIEYNQGKIFLITTDIPTIENIKWTKISSVIYKEVSYSLWEGVK